MSRIRILFTIPNFHTAGSGRALLNIAQGLDAQFFDVHIMCMHNKGEFYKVVEKSGIPIHILNYTSPARPIMKMLRECWRISRKFKEIAPDIIHSYHYSSDYTEAIASKMAGIPWVFTKKNMNWGGASKNAWKLRSFLAKKIAVQNTDMIKNFYPRNQKVVLIPRGVDVSSFSPKNPSDTEKLFPEFPQKQRLLICVANFVPVKGIETLIQAFNKLKDKYKNWSLLLVGDDKNDYGQELHEMVGNLDLKDRIKFSGKLLDIRPQLNRTEIFVLPTKDEGRREGSPVALLEAMANAKVVIASDISGIRDQLAIFPESLFKASDIMALSQKLDFYMGKTKQELKEVGDSFFGHVHSEYPIKKEIESHAALYKTIVGQ